MFDDQDPPFLQGTQDTDDDLDGVVLMNEAHADVERKAADPSLSLDDLRERYGEHANPRHPLYDTFPLAAHMNPYLHRLAADVMTFAAHINAAQYEWLVLLAEFDRVKAWEIDHELPAGGWENTPQGQEFNGTAAWLAWKCGLGIGTAREKVRVARALPALPKISAAFAAGELSYSVVREITRVATPEREADLLNACEYGTVSHVLRVVHQMRHADQLADGDTSFSAWDRRRATWWERDDGMVEIRVLLAPDQGSTVIAALDQLTDEINQEARAEVEGIDELVLKSRLEQPIDQRRADAMERLAERALAQSQTQARASGPNDRDSNTDCNRDSESKITGGDLTTLMVNVDTDQLTGVRAGTLARMSCDCAVIASINDASGKPLSVGRKTRTVPPPIRRALERRDIGCTFPGCTNHRHVDAHHITHWAHGGETKLNNLTLLCRRHHRLVHEAGFSVRMSTIGRPIFFSPRGNMIDNAPRVRVPRETRKTWLVRRKELSGPGDIEPPPVFV